MLAFSFSMLRAIFTSFLFSLNLGYYLQPAQAQVVGDQTLDSQVDLVDDNHLVITGGQAAGQNLFHSFSEFSVPADFTVHFNNDVDIANIFSRVTGGAISDINGLIRANGNASLFLLNPAGIIFGPNAQLDIGGSFIATTAEAIRFQDGIEFSAANTETEVLLTVNIPVGLQYGKSPGAIISNGVSVPDSGIGEPSSFPLLSINPGNTIAFIGGEILLRNITLDTDAASTEIGSVSEREFVTLRPDRNGWSMDYDSVNEFGKVELSDDVDILSGNGGSVQIRGKEIKVRNSIIDIVISEEILADNISLIATDLIEIDDSFILTQVGGERNIEDLRIDSEGGNIFLQSNRINISNGSIISSGTTSLGNDGNITIYAKDLVELSGKNSSLISTSTRGDGKGGDIVVNTRNLLIQDGGQIEAASFFDGGEAGTITVNATESIEIAGTGFALDFAENEMESREILVESGFFATTQSGNGGEIDLTANSILLRDNGNISTLAENNGDGGNIDIATDTLVLFDPSAISANAQEGRGGNIQINTQGLFLASGDEQIDASSERGIDGEVDINILDVDTRIDTIIPERSPLVVENLIYTGCSFGKDSINNQFNYIGRGGLPLNPMEEITTEDVMVDLGQIELPKTQNQTPESTFATQYEPDREIREANSFHVDKHGNVKLVAQTSTVEFSSTCQFKELIP